jgi:phosphoribosylaminoimidazole-succinocarboxamide synthase
MTVLAASCLPLPLLRRGKVREVYEVDADRLLLVASDRVSAFDVVMGEAIPYKGAVLTQLSAFWFDRLASIIPHHLLTADAARIVATVPALAPYADQLRGRAMLVVRTEPVAFECVVRGYLSGSAWVEYRRAGTLAGEPLPSGLIESARLDPPIFSPATKADTGHDVNVSFSRMSGQLGPALAQRLREVSLALYAAGRDYAATRGIIVADTKFEFGRDRNGTLRLIDEVLTPDSSRFWPADQYHPGGPQPSFDKQPLRDWLAAQRDLGRWNGEAPPPPLPAEIITATSRRYLAAYRLLTGRDLDLAAGTGGREA